MIKILYNPLSRNGSHPKTIERVKKEAYKMFQMECTCYNFFELDMKEFLSQLTKDDVVFLLGGDGTIDYAANYIRGIDVKNDIYLYKAGTGNDFGREFKEKCIHLNEYITNLPKVTVLDKEYVFVNDTGLGISGTTCYYVNNGKNKSKIHFFLNAIKAFFHCKKLHVKFTVDGKEYEYKNAWFVEVMNGRYFGGGMKLSPKSDRLDDTLELVVVNGVPKFILPFILPTIYFGGQVIFKNIYHVYKGKKFHIEVVGKPVVQERDGETVENVTFMDVER